MLKGKPTEYGTGLIIYGDLYDLKSLYKTVSEISNYVGEENPDSDLYMSMAFSLRKAWEGHREEFNIGEPEYWDIKYRGFKIYWPDFILTLNLIRQRVGYLGTNPEMQANIYRLEQVGMEALREYDEVYGEKYVKWIIENKIMFGPYLLQILDEVRLNHLSEKNGKPRFKRLLQNMKPFILFSKEHSAMVKKLEKQAEKYKCKVEDLKYSGEIYDDLKYKW